MADVWVVFVHMGKGMIGGVFNTITDAQAYIGERPSCACEVQKHTVDVNIGKLTEQRPT